MQNKVINDEVINANELAYIHKKLDNKILLKQTFCFSEYIPDAVPLAIL